MEMYDGICGSGIGLSWGLVGGCEERERGNAKMLFGGTLVPRVCTTCVFDFLLRLCVPRSMLM